MSTKRQQMKHALLVRGKQRIIFVDSGKTLAPHGTVRVAQVNDTVTKGTWIWVSEALNTLGEQFRGRQISLKEVIEQGRASRRKLL